MEKAKIRVENFNVRIGKNDILKNINCIIPERKITVILGFSGCGKTTLLKSMNRLTDLYSNVEISGDIYLNDQNIYDKKMEVTDLRRKMGLMSQRPSSLPMSIFDNIAYGLRISGRSNKLSLKPRVENYLRMVNLWDEVHHRLKDSASSLSIGQQQRLCLARGLAVDPEMILADEPTSALDPISSQAIEKKLVELKNNFTIVVVTHTLRQAKRIADNVIFMYLGEIIEQGPAEEFFNNPKHEMTKRFISGVIN